MFQLQKRLAKWLHRYVKNGLKKTRFWSKCWKFCIFWSIRFGSNFASKWSKYVSNYTWRDLTAHNWQNWKRVFLSRYCHEIYRVEAVGLKNYNYILFEKLRILWNLGQFLEKSIFCQYYWQNIDFSKILRFEL